MDTIILASDSQRRKDYFQLLGLPFKAIPSPAEEIMDILKYPEAIASELAISKVNNVMRLLAENEKSWIIGADTLISLDGKIFGKPKGRKDAREMLLSLSGHAHEVITAIALKGPKNSIDCRSVTSSVRFASLKEDEIEWYLNTGEWENAAGAYKIQGLAACFIEEIQGSYSGIVGLPLHVLYAMLKDNGYPYGGNTF
jgi:septum formation protein